MSYLVPWSGKSRAIADYLSWRSPIHSLYYGMTGYTQMRNTERSTAAQISYNDYIRGGNERALADWNKNVGSKGRTIKYPELSYAGRIYQANTGSYRAMYDADTASANYYGNLPYRGIGLYGIGSKLSRWL